MQISQFSLDSASSRKFFANSVFTFLLLDERDAKRDEDGNEDGNDDATTTTIATKTK